MTALTDEQLADLRLRSMGDDDDVVTLRSETLRQLLDAVDAFRTGQPAEATTPVYRCLGCDKGWRTATKDGTTWHHLPRGGQAVCVAQLAIDNDEQRGPQPTPLTSAEWEAVDTMRDGLRSSSPRWPSVMSRDLLSAIDKLLRSDKRQWR